MAKCVCCGLESHESERFRILEVKHRPYGVYEAANDRRHEAVFCVSCFAVVHALLIAELERHVQAW